MRVTLPVLLLVVSPAALAAGAELNINPVRVTLSHKAPASQVEVSNSGDAPDELQSQVYTWTRKNCVDSQTLGDDLVISPPIFSVQPATKQVVRVLLTNPAVAVQERTLRIVLTEIGAVHPEPGSVATRLAVSLPVFVVPPGAVAPKLEWSAVREGTQLHITVHNAGNAHSRMRSLNLVGRDGVRLSAQAHTDYLLAGDTCDWVVPAQNLPPGAHLVAVTEDRETTVELPTP
jgi:fimbrial chaperone protein